MKLSDRFLRFSELAERHAPAIGADLTIAGRRVHYVAAGPHEGLPVVLLHGASGNVRDWQMSVLPGLVRTRRVIAFDRPGLGYSDPLPGHGVALAAQIAHLGAALHALGHRRYVLAGHSYGGSLAIRWALERPDEVAGLALISAPVMDWGGGGVGPQYRFGGRALIGDALAWLVPLRATPGFLTGQLREVFAPDPVPRHYLEAGGVALAARPASFRANAAQMLGLYRQIARQCAHYDRIACPVEIIHGTDDDLVPAAIHAVPLSKRIAGANLTLIERVGHMPHHAATQTVIDRLHALAGAAGR